MIAVTANCVLVLAKTVKEHLLTVSHATMVTLLMTTTTVFLALPLEIVPPLITSMVKTVPFVVTPVSSVKTQQITVLLAIPDTP